MKNILLFVLAIIISFIPGAVGMFFTPHESNNVWFNGLNNSLLTPDGWVFGFAWTILYLLLGIALFFIMKKPVKKVEDKIKSYCLFFVHMVLNAGWTLMFFGIQMPVLAMLVLFTLTLISVWMACEFYKISKTASILVWPYILWLLFAMYLNFTILVLN